MVSGCDEHKSPVVFTITSEEYNNIAGKDKSLKVAESLFRASEVVNCSGGGGGGYGFCPHNGRRVLLRSGFYSVNGEKGLVRF